MKETDYNVYMSPQDDWRVELNSGEVYKPFGLDGDYFFHLGKYNPQADYFQEKDRLELVDEMLKDEHADGFRIANEIYWKPSKKEAQRLVREMKPFDRPFTAIRRMNYDDVKSFFLYKTSVRILGEEIYDFTDAGVGYYGYPQLYPGYLEANNNKLGENIKDAKDITIGNARDGMTSARIYPKKYIEAITLHQCFINKQCLIDVLDYPHNGVNKEDFTGEEKTWVLNPQEEDEEILDILINHRVIQLVDDEDEE